MAQDQVLIGLQISESGSQITWFGKQLKEPQTLSLQGETQDGMTPVPYQVWRQIIGRDSFGKTVSGDSVSVSPAGEYLRNLSDTVPAARDKTSIRICVTVPSLSGREGENLKKALLEAGISDDQIYLQDWRTSFFYYVVNKRQALCSGDAALLLVKDQCLKGYILHIDYAKVPSTAVIYEGASCDISDKARAGRSDEEWDQERDRLLYELLGKLFERRNVTDSYLYGTYFEGGWAERSFRYLTFHRHAFLGQNLFSKGACFGAMARTGLIHMPDIVLAGIDMVKVSVGLNARVKGHLQYIPLIRAGVNWYEGHGECELIPESDRNLVILTEEAGEVKEDESAEARGKTKDREATKDFRKEGILKESRNTGQVAHIMRLDHFPDRPDRASRLRLRVWFSSPSTLEAEVEDLGFGSMYPSSGRIWRRSIRLDREDQDCR